MTTATLLSGLKPITAECFHVFAPFYAERAKHYVYPRYMQSVCALLDMGHCYYSVIRAAHGQVLAIFKRTAIFGKVGVQMMVMPVSLSGSAEDEKETMLAALSVGISLRATAEDIRRYRIPQRYLTENAGAIVTGQRFGQVLPKGYRAASDEYVYEAHRAVEMKGSRYRKQRYQANRIFRHSGFALSSGAHPQADSVVRAWDERYERLNGTATEQVKLWNICKTAPTDSVAINNIIINGRLEALSVIERLAPSQWVIVQRVRNYDSKLNDVGSAMQWADCHSALTLTDRHRVAQTQTYLNIGMADTEGLQASKEALLPCHHQKIYNFKTAKTNQAILKQYFR